MGTILGTQLGDDLAGGAAPVDPVAATFPHTRLRADTGATTGATLTWVDMISGTRTFSQATAANQPTLVSSYANMNNQAAFTFDGNDSLQYTGAASDYTFLHSGELSFVAAIRTPAASSASLNFIYSSCQGNAVTSSVGALISMTNSGCVNGTIANYNNGSLFSLVYPSSSWLSLRGGLPLGVGSIQYNASGSFASTLNYNGSPSAAAPFQALVIGTTTDGRFLQPGSAIAELVWWNRKITDGELASVVSYLVSRYAVTA